MTLAPRAAPKLERHDRLAPLAASFAYDLNLGFRVKTHAWGGFFARQKCGVAGCTDLASMTRGLEQHAYTACFLPAANAYFVRHDPAYRGIASATMGRSGATQTSSLLVVRRDSPAATPADLKGLRYGRINAYCTTSYFAPAILLERSGFAIESFFVSIRDVGAWQKQIDAVVAGIVDASMVDADTWAAKPSNALLTRVIGRVDDLPTAAVIGLAADTTFVPALTGQLLAEPRDPNALFSGFAPYQTDLVQSFYAEAERAFAG